MVFGEQAGHLLFLRLEIVLFLAALFCFADHRHLLDLFARLGQRLGTLNALLLLLLLVLLLALLLSLADLLLEFAGLFAGLFGRHRRLCWSRLGLPTVSVR
jgi:hypothetical protein